MSNIEPNIIDPTKGPPLPPDSVPGEDVPGSDHVGDDAIREPDPAVPPIEPDPEERRGPGRDDIERASSTQSRTTTGR